MYSYSDVEYSDSEKKWIKYIPSDDIKLCKNITIPNDITQLKNYCFYGCENIENIIISDNVIEIGIACFANCKKLKNVELSSKITELPNDTFYNCCELESITITPNLKTVKPTALLNCKSLKTIWIKCDDYSTYLSYVNNIKNKEISNKCKWKLVVSTKTFNITKINNYDKCSYLVLKNVESIQNCQNNSLLFIDIITNNAVILSDYAFKDCKKLKRIKCIINNTNEPKLNEAEILQLSKGCFMNCEKLAQIINFNNQIDDVLIMSDVPDEAFKNCFELNNIIFKIKEESQQGKEESSQKDKEKEESQQGKEECILKQANIKIGKSSFENCKFKNIDLSNCIKLDEKSFMNCDKLTEVVLPLVQHIPKSCFENCFNIRKLVFPDTIRKIDEAAFKKCYKLENIDLRFVKIIDKNAFRKCSKLENLKSKELKIIGEYAFYKCFNLKTIDLLINKIKAHAFEWCINLESINLENIKQIEKYAFAHNLKLSKVNIKGIVKQLQTVFEDTEILTKINIISDTIDISLLTDNNSLTDDGSKINVKLSDELKIIVEKIKENKIIMEKIKEDDFDEMNKSPQLILSTQQKLIENKLRFIEIENECKKEIKIIRQNILNDNNINDEDINSMYDGLSQIENKLNVARENYEKNRKKILLIEEPKYLNSIDED